METETVALLPVLRRLEVVMPKNSSKAHLLRFPRWLLVEVVLRSPWLASDSSLSTFPTLRFSFERVNYC